MVGIDGKRIKMSKHNSLTFKKFARVRRKIKSENAAKIIPTVPWVDKKAYKNLAYLESRGLIK